VNVETAQQYRQRVSIPRGQTIPERVPAIIPESISTPEPEAVTRLRQKIDTGEALNILDYQAISKYYPEEARRAAAEQKSFESVKSKLESGEPLSLFDAMWLSSRSPETAKAYAEAQRKEEQLTGRVESLQEKLATDQPLDISDAILLSSRFPDVAKQYKAYQTEKAAYEAKLEKQTAFWTGLGFPQYARYEPFQIPEGQEVKSVREVEIPLVDPRLYGIRKGDVMATGEVLSKQLQIELLPKGYKEPVPSLSEQLASFKMVPLAQGIGLGKTPSISDIKGMGSFLLGKPREAHPLVSAAGILAPFEATAYTVGRLAGLKTPSIPPTALSDAISYGLSYAMTGKGSVSSESARMREELSGTEWGTYQFGSLLGDYLLSKGISKAAQPVVGKVAGLVKGRAAGWLTASYEESAKAAELWQPSLTERLVMKLTGATPRELPTAIIGLPTLIEEGTPDLASNILDVRGLQGTLGLGAKEMKQLPSLIAGEDLLDFTKSLNTVGFGLTSASAETAKEVSEVGVKALAKKALPYVVYQAGRQVSLAEPQGLLGFEKYPYRLQGYSTKLGFAKQRLPSISDLLKDTRAETTLSKLLLEPTETLLPAISTLPDLAARGLSGMSADIFGAGVVLGLAAAPRGKAAVATVARLRREEALKSLSLSKALLGAEEKIGMDVETSTALQQKVALKQRLKTVQLQRTVQLQVTSTPLSRQILQLPRPPRPRRDEDLFKKLRKRRPASKGFKTKAQWYEYPIATETEMSRYVLGKSPSRRRQSNGRRRK
jgi:hypothetical protein